MIERWLIAIRDHPARPPLAQSHVLTMLALRMNWATGRGFASARQLGQDAGVSEPTVHRATRWGRDSGYLLRTRRGHRVSADRILASEWRLTQPITGERLEKPTDQNGRPNRSAEPTQPITTDPPSRTVSSRTVSSARADEADAPRADTKPPWCGFCDERTRLYGDPPHRCATCHPLAGQQTQPISRDRLDDAEPLSGIVRRMIDGGQDTP